jgi:poly-gamma-glutamate synthesis protein (capsule biosynthesis protein)
VDITHRFAHLALATATAGAFLAACNLPSAGDPSGIPTAPMAASPTDTPLPPLPPTPEPIRIWMSPALPEALRQPLEALQAVGDRAVVFVAAPDEADVRAEPVTDSPLAVWIYAVAAPFPTVADSIALGELQALWGGAEGEWTRVVVRPADAAAARIPLGSSGYTVWEEVSDQVTDRTWEQPGALAVVPFEKLDPRLKVLTLDGQSPLWKAFDPASYPLAIGFGFTGDAEAVEAVRGAVLWPATNRDPARLTVVMVTGVTALTRATAWKMDQKGVDYPAQLIGDWLREADILHISNEVAFSETCPKADPAQSSLRFCSQPQQIALLESIGVDVVELTGNHVMDWGAEALQYTLEQHRARGWLDFGGGADLEDSLQPALFEHNGNRIAFLGCNQAGPSTAWATIDRPGAAPCELDRLFAETARLRQAGTIVIFTYQWAESYRPSPVPAQADGFREAADAGASIVSGSQAHQPQSFEFRNGAFIHYGLGNLFFDQMASASVRQEFLDRHVIYAGRHISTELLTTYLEDFSQPRPMTPEERTEFLTALFTASGW